MLIVHNQTVLPDFSAEPGHKPNCRYLQGRIARRSAGRLCKYRLMVQRSVITESLEIAFEEFGPADGSVAVLLHGFPYAATACIDSACLLAESGMRVLVPSLRGHGATRFVASDIMRSGQQGALGQDLLQFLDALKVSRAVLAGYDWGGRAACIVAALHPERVIGLVSGAGYNIFDHAHANAPGTAEQELRYWYQWYFQTERGQRGLESNRREFTRLLWRLWSPTWAFTDGDFAAAATAFDNPDWADVVIHSYRHRYVAVPGDPRYETIEAALTTAPVISVPTIVLHGAEDGVDPPDRAATPVVAAHFSGPYEWRVLIGVGHNLPQEAPEAFATAVQDILHAGTPHDTRYSAQ